MTATGRKTQHEMLDSDALDANDRSDGRVFTPSSTALFTDLYHVDSAYVCWLNDHNGLATFDLYTRRAPFGGAFMLAAGLGPALDYIRNFRYSDDDLGYLERIKGYKAPFLEYLRNLWFSGDIDAMPEGEIAFPDEPLLRVTAPFPEAMLLESGLLRAIGVSTLIATKAARLAIAAEGRPVSDFAFRRAHDPHLAARSGFIGGCSSTSFVAAAREYDIPAAGTVPHALIQAFASEREAFRAIAMTLLTYSLLLDTYDVERATRHAIEISIAAERDHGNRLLSVRLDSGDIAADSRKVRVALDGAGLQRVKILASGDIDEFRIRELLDAGALIDGFGVGGNLGVGLGSVESGTVGGVIGAVYKLVWYEGDGAGPARIKLAGDKGTWPGRKRVWRTDDFNRDVIALDEEEPPSGTRAISRPWIVGGRLVEREPSLHDISERAQASLAALPPAYKALTPNLAFPVDRSKQLVDLRNATIAGLITD